METERVTRVGKNVRAFYETYSFPGYEACETGADLVQKAKQSRYADLLDAQLPLGVTILEVGCGTGQLSAFLSMTHRTVVGIDFSFHSLQHGHRFSQACRLQDVHFAQMDLFDLGFRDGVFDYVVCSGVLHHTADAAEGFQRLCRILKPGGCVIVGLYNAYGRAMTRLWSRIFRLTGGRGAWHDRVLRRHRLDEDKRRIWLMDQYYHPHEQVFTVDDVLTWFARNDIEYLNSIAKISLSDPLTAAEQLWEPHDPGTSFDHLLSQLKWVFTAAEEGGLFLTIGRKRS